MTDRITLKLAVSVLTMGITMVGCTASADMRRPSAAPAISEEKAAAKLRLQVDNLVRQSKFAEALSIAERMVELSPVDVDYRMVLADLYLKNGRFQAAETTFSDVVALNPGNAPAALRLALTQIANGREYQAVITLDRIAGSAPDSDLGLAYALAGQIDHAIELLEEAARRPDANGRVRQNLALAHAFAGNWQKARIIASQDVTGLELNRRLYQWAAMARPEASPYRVASLLGVRPVDDPGQPVHLVLSQPEPEETQYAEVEAPQRTINELINVPVAAVEAEPRPREIAFVQAPSLSLSLKPVMLSPARPSLPGDAVAVAVPVSIALGDVPAVRIDADMPDTPIVEAVAETSPIRFASADGKAIGPFVSDISAQFTKMKTDGAAAKTPVKKARIAPVSTVSGGKASRYVVQIGAFSTAPQVQLAWASANKRYGVGQYKPVHTTISLPGKGTFHRLAVSGFGNKSEAEQLCRSIRTKGGNCFVRVNGSADSSPVRFASRRSVRHV